MYISMLTFILLELVKSPHFEKKISNQYYRYPLLLDLKVL